VQELFVSSLWSSLKYLVSHRIDKYDFVYFWFSSFNFTPLFLMAKILRLKTVIVAGGYDVACVPEIGYGGGTKSLPQKILRNFFFRSACGIINVSLSNHHDLIQMSPQSKAKAEIIPFGFSNPDYEIIPFERRPKKIVTIGGVNKVTFKRKGLHSFALLSKTFPDWDFVIVGKFDDETKSRLEQMGGSNLRFTGFLSDESFHQEVSSSKFNLQLSYHEAFGISVVDAALLGVYPVVFDSYSLPEVVGPGGTVVPFGDLEAVEKEIRRLAETGYDALLMKESFLKRFSFDDKKRKLLNYMSSI
jgi:glycosyltransferase involved in cell wall biosynthesis